LKNSQRRPERSDKVKSTQCHRLQLAVYFRDSDQAAQLIGPASRISMVNPASPIIWRNALFEGIAAFELYRRGRSKRKWRRTALQALKKTQKWVDAGNVNCVHILYLLKAEKAAIMDGDNLEQARQLYDKAIVTAARNGFRNDRALATERCADMYAWRISGGEDKTEYEYWYKEYLERARVCYEEIEAFGKVEDLLVQDEESRRQW